jgi:hypothetical protein
MADADLIPLSEFAWTAWLSRRHAVYDRAEQSIVYEAGYLLPRTRCRCWGWGNGYSFGGGVDPGASFAFVLAHAALGLLAAAPEAAREYEMQALNALLSITARENRDAVTALDLALASGMSERLATTALHNAIEDGYVASRRRMGAPAFYWPTPDGERVAREATNPTADFPRDAPVHSPYR